MPALTRPQNQPNRNREIIGHYLKEKRLELGLTQQEMLERIGSDAWFTVWSSIERGERNLPPQRWKVVAEALGIDKKEFAQVMIRYTNPWAYELLYGSDPALRAELNSIPSRYSA
jgi:transcriptional regulator with XRE-family HTH domain